MPGTLFVVATPIGNLEDITLRALRVLREADVIAAEDTRHTARLLHHHAIATPTVSFHQHNTRARVPQLTERLTRGDRIALVTDAGTPGVSDPGTELIRACIEAGIEVDPIPGATAPLAAVLGSGFPITPMTVFGFPPVKGTARATWLADLAAISHTVTFFEAPHRIEKTLAEIAAYLGDRPLVIGRELTKRHQTFLRGTADTLRHAVQHVRGELTVVVGPAPATSPPAAPPDDRAVAARFLEISESSGRSRRDAVDVIAREFGISPKRAYAAIERAKVEASPACPK